MRTPERSTWVFFVALGLVAFGLNWLWEMAQMPAYAEMVGRSWRETALRCMVASLGDTALTLAIWSLGALAAGDLRWGREGKWNAYAAAALLAGICAAAFEWKSQASGWWSYTRRMPILPLLGVGLWPVLQLALLVPLSFAVACWSALKVSR